MRNLILKRFVTALWLVFAYSSTSFSQGDTLTDKELIPIFLAISKSDQSHVKEPEIRKEIFIENFNTLIGIMKKQGFPVLTEDYRRKKIKNCIPDATQMTLIHILQTKPSLLLNNGHIRLFKIAIESGKLKKNIMATALWIFETDQKEGRSEPWNDKMKHYYELALSEFDITLDAPKEIN